MFARSVGCFLLAGLLSITLVQQSNHDPLQVETGRGLLVPPEEEKQGPGTKDDPFARWRYEFEKLKDPRTGDIPANIRQRELAFAKRLPTREGMFANKRSQKQAISWVFRGPENLGGRTRALAIDVSNENVIIAGGVSGGMFRSENAGQTWSRTSQLSDLKSVTCLVQDKRPGKTNIWYYGTGEARANSAGYKSEYFGDGLSKSTDGGRTWKQLEATLSRTPHNLDDFDYIMSVAVDPSNTEQDEVYCATTRAVYRSVDGGETWEIVLGSTGGQASYCEVACSNTGVLYASIFSSSTSGGLYRSVDGINWTDISPDDLNIGWERAVLAIAPSDENQVYFLMSTPAGGANGNTLLKYVHTLEGGQWSNRSDNLPNDLQTYWSYCMTLAVRPDNANVVFVGGMNLYRSTNGFSTSGATRQVGGHGYPTQHADNHVLTFVPGKPNVAYNGNDGGIYRSENMNSQNVSWTDLNQGYITSQFYTTAVDKSAIGSDMIVGGLQDNGTWVSQSGGTRNWQNIWGADGGYSHITDRGRMIYASYQNGVIYRLQRNDDGAVTSYTRIDPSGAWNYEFINPFAVDPNDPNQMYVAENQNIWRTLEATTLVNGSDSPIGNGWESFKATQNQRVTALSVSREPADILYYGTLNGTLFRVNNASDPTSEPVNLSAGKGLPGGYVTSLAIDPLDANKVLVAYSNYSVVSMVYTSDGGETWARVAGNLEENPNGTGAGPAVKWVATLSSPERTIHFAGTTTGLYSCTALDGENTEWVQEASDVIGNTVVDMIDIRPEDGFVAVATHGNGVYSAYVALSDVAVATPQSPSLGLNVSPNPATDFTRISFNLEQTSPVEIQIADVSGKIVFSEKSQMQAGSNVIRWNGLDQFNRSLPSGAYSLVVRTPYATDRRQIIRRK